MLQHAYGNGALSGELFWAAFGQGDLTILMYSALNFLSVHSQWKASQNFLITPCTC